MAIRQGQMLRNLWSDSALACKGLGQASPNNLDFSMSLPNEFLSHAVVPHLSTVRECLWPHCCIKTLTIIFPRSKGDPKASVQGSVQALY